LRDARAYSCFFSQIILVYLHPFCRNSLFCNSKGQEITINLYFLGFKVRSFKVIAVDIPKKLIASACCDKQHVCAYLQPFYARAANSGKITAFRGYPSLTPSCARLLESRWSELALLKSIFSVKNFIRRLSWSISTHRSLCDLNL